MRISLSIPNRAVRVGIASVLSMFAGTVLAAAQCTPNPTNQTVTICSPASGATVSSPVNVVAVTTDTNSVNLVQIYVDGVKAFDSHSNQVNTNVTLADGTHRLTVQATDSAGVTFKTTESITVSSGSGGGGGAPCTLNPPNQTVTTV